jgi:GxxExxY protein
MREGQASALELNEISRGIVDSAIQVRKKLGPGLLESIYRECLVHEMRERGLRVEEEVSVPIVYDGIPLKNPLRLDVLVEGQIILELKAVEEILAVHKSQLLSYLRLSDKRLGFLFNFNVVLMKDGMRRIVNNL